MKRTRTAAQNITVIAIASLVGVTGCTTYVEQRPVVVSSQPAPVEPPPPPPAPIYVEPAPVEVVVRDERDFYEPLDPYGHWEYIGAYGRCWVPDRVEPAWRPYSNGHWEPTDAGWYWVSDEPWGWATYHYGRWDFDPRVGWYWIPQIMWAPAWVTWHRGDGYIGWSPLPPSARFSSSGFMEVNTSAIPQRGYVFVEERRFLEPLRPATVANNTTVINKTVNITNIKVVNNIVINEGPGTQVIEQASGHKLHPVPARELRHKIETPVAAAHRNRGTESAPRLAAQPTPPMPGTAAPALSQVQTDAERKAAERARQEKIQAERRAQQKAQAEAERARVESERQAKIEAERQAQAERDRVAEQRRKAEAERKAQLDAEQRAREQARQAEAEAARKKQEAARKKQEADLRARELAEREARQKQAQTEEARLKQELERNAHAQSQDVARGSLLQPHPTQPLYVPKAEEARRPNAIEKKNQTEAERRAAEQQKGNRKGQNKKGAELEPAPAATNSPVAGAKAD